MAEDNKTPAQAQAPVQEEKATPIIKDPEKVLNALEAVRKENDDYKKQLAELKQNQIDSEEYSRLKSLEAEIAASKLRAEEEQLKKEQNWDELTRRKLAEQEAKYLAQIETLNGNLTSTQKELQEQFQAKQNLDSKVNEYTRRQTAFDQYILNGGKREYFENVWKGELRDRTILEEGQIKIAKSTNSDEILRDEAGEPLQIKDWMVNYRSNGGGIFFNPVNNPSGSGVTPANNSSGAKVENRTIFITRKEAGSQKFMNDLKAQLDGKDPLTAISEGLVIVKND